MADENEKKGRYLSLPLLELYADKEFPGNLYLCIRHKMVRYRNKGDLLEAEEFNKLVYHHVKNVFIEEGDRKLFDEWIIANETKEAAEQAALAGGEEAKPVVQAIVDQRRAMMDIFESPRDDKQVIAAIETSRKMVMEFLRKPFVTNNIQNLQRYSKGCVDHSVNVSVLSVFLGLRMGYSHQLILENLALGGLFHDVGKMLVEPKDEKISEAQMQIAMQAHPKLAMELLDRIKEVTNEVRMIVAQHHEFLDGTGYPNKLKGLAIYDLARLVAIANIYDNLISESKADQMVDRAKEAIGKLETDYEGKLDGKKLEKIIKILRYSFV